LRVGNDIVDLTDPQNREKSLDHRYVSRVLTPAELVRLDQFPEKDVLLWALWAGKEAAFKVLAKSDPSLPFIPRAYEVHLDDYGLRGTSTDAGTCNPHVEGAVLTPEGAIPLRLYRRCTYIHALALSDGEDYFDFVFWRVEVMPELKGVDSLEVESRIVREALKRCVATHLGWNQKDMEIRRTESRSHPGPPRLYYQGKRTTLDLSLSHDGHFGAYAVLIQKPERDARGATQPDTGCAQEKP
jgi:phosphopantetheinyl transferase (holo-ACP synthase)